MMLQNVCINTFVKLDFYTRGVIEHFKKNEKGVTAVEYALVVAGVAGIVSIIFGTKGPVNTMLTDIFAKVGTAMNQLVTFRK